MQDKELLRRINAENLGRLMGVGCCWVAVLLVGYFNRSRADAVTSQDVSQKASVASVRDSVAAPAIVLKAKNRTR